MVSDGYGLANAATNSHSPAAMPAHSRRANSRMTGRHLAAARGVNAGPTSARSLRCRSPVWFRMFASICSRSRPPVTPNRSAISRPGKAVSLARRKNSPDSWSSNTSDSGDLASQPCRRTSASRWWYTSPTRPGSL